MSRTRITAIERRLLPNASAISHLWTGASLSKPKPLVYLCAFAVVAGLILGGGTTTGILFRRDPPVARNSLLLLSIWKIVELPLTKQARLALWFCVAIALVPLLQLVPLPPWLWTALPNRQPSVEAFELLGKPVPWMPISVSPEATWLSALSLIPPITIFLATLLLSYRERRLLTLVIIAVGILSVFLGLLQVAQGETSALRFFEVTNSLEAVGFFANRNHFAALLYCLIPFVIAWTLDKMAGSASSKKAPSSYLALSSYNVSSIIAAIAGFTTLVIILAGEVTARSRAGLGLTFVALFTAMALGSSNRRVGQKFTTANMIILGAIVVAVAFSLQFSLFRVAERFSDSQQGDRLTIALTTLEAARAYMPVGAGLGTFRTVYPMFEKPEQVSISFVNRAHNDILELSLETGMVGLVLMVLFAVWLARRSVKIWRNSPPDGASALDWSLARAGTIVVALLIAHSFVDYPLRTGGMMTIMAFACALLVEPLVSAQSGERWRAAGERERKSGTHRLNPPPSAGTTLASLPRKTTEAAKPREDLQAALVRIGQSAQTVALGPANSPPSKPIGSVKSPGELQAALNRIEKHEPTRPKATEQALPPPSEIQQSDLASAETVSLATATASLPSQLREAAQGASIPAERRWGIDAEWPEAWSNKVLAKDSAAKSRSANHRQEARMIDLHCHLLPGIDDGATDISASIAMAKAFVADGVTVVACTPHILPGVYANSGPQIRTTTAALQQTLDEVGIPLRLVTGADNHITPTFVADRLGIFCPWLIRNMSWLNHRITWPHPHGGPVFQPVGGRLRSDLDPSGAAQQVKNSTIR